MNFMEALDQNVGDIHRPPNMPIGTYRWMVDKFEMKEVNSPKGSWDVIDFTMRCVAPTEDVDSDDLANYGDVTKVTRRVSFMFDKNDKAGFERTLFQCRNFLEKHLKIDGAASMTLKEAIANSKAHVCLGTVKWRPDPNDPNIQYDEIGRTAPEE